MKQSINRIKRKEKILTLILNLIILIVSISAAILILNLLS